MHEPCPSTEALAEHFLIELLTARAAVMAAVADDMAKAKSFLELTNGESGVIVEVARPTIDLLDGRKKKAESRLTELAANENHRPVEGTVNFVGYSLLEADRPKPALKFLKLNTELFPEAFNTWDSLGEAHMQLGNDDKAISSFEKSLELNPENSNAQEMIVRIQEGGGTRD